MMHEAPCNGHDPLSRYKGSAAEDLLALAAHLKIVSAEFEQVARTMTAARRSDDRRVGSADRRATQVTADYIRGIIRNRRAREAYFQANLFADPAWDVLLDLTAARLESRNVCVSSLTIAAAVPATTALRWIKTMTENGMLIRRQDPTDARRCFVDLSDEVFEKMLAYLSST